MRNAVLFLVSLGLIWGVGCGSNRDPSKDVRNFHKQIKKVEAKPTEMFPLSGFAASEELKEKILQVDSLIELFPLDHLVKLEFTEQAIIAYIRQIVYLDGCWFILDDVQNKVFKFAADGSFVKTIGRLGKGPGEFIKPSSLKHCYGNNIAIFDAGTGKINVYDANGVFVFSSSPNSDNMRIIGGDGFVWPKRERLYQAAYSSLNPDAPWHVILDYSQDEYKVVSGFGERFEPFKLLQLGSWNFPSMEIINGVLWVGPSYFDYLEFYDLEGRYFGRTPDVRRSKKLVRDDFKDLDRKKRDELFKRVHNCGLIQVGPIVVANMFWVRDIFDINGHLIRANMKFDKMWPLLESYSQGGGHFGVSYLFPNDTAEHWDEKDHEALVAMGLNLDDIDNENPYLRIGRLVDGASIE